ncbi:hypothetical protein SFRURICE_010012 [Spodoptera frugiperda]|nr:hypothetical protein SFRURICE_010012 [Spodoptera frugiperda]
MNSQLKQLQNTRNNNSLITQRVAPCRNRTRYTLHGNRANHAVEKHQNSYHFISQYSNCTKLFMT